MEANSKHKINYAKLRDDIDFYSAKLEKEHTKHLNCKSGCDLCCLDYSIFPVEFNSILQDLRQQNFQPDTLDAKKSENECVFLKDHKCTIYNTRPIICRTHGLPLVDTNDDGEWELSACELNFTKFNFEKFTTENTFPQDKFNSKLFLLNREFISDFSKKEYGEFELIPIKNLIKVL